MSNWTHMETTYGLDPRATAGRRGLGGGRFCPRAALALVVLFLVACTPAAPPADSIAETDAMLVVPAQGRVRGAIARIDQERITLEGGELFDTGPEALIVRAIPAAPEDLREGDFVAITAMLQPDGSLLASIVNIFAEEMRGLGEGQRPMADGKLMTNATIDTVDPDGFTAEFPGGTARILLSPDVEVRHYEIGRPHDLVPGVVISALVNNGTASSVTILSDPGSPSG